MVAARTRPPPSFCVGPMPHDVTQSPEPAPTSGGGTTPTSGMIPSFMNNLMSPFMNCWQPPINPCVTPGRPSRPPPAVVSPMVDRHQQQQQSPQKSHQQPTSNIRDPHPNDVLCGRGGSSNRHVGNLNFRSLVAANKEMYVTLTKKQKMLVARKIVETIHCQDPPGRFLQKDSQTGLWFDIGMPRSLEKTSQALREKSSSSSSSSTATAATSVTSSVTSSAADETLSDPGSLVSSATKSPPLSPRSSSISPPSTACSSPLPTKTNPSEVPDITIPEHLEAQFRPNKHLEARPPPPTGWGGEYRHEYPPPHGYHHHHHHPPPPHPHHPPHAPPPPHQPYLHPYPRKDGGYLPYRPHPAYSGPQPYVPVDHREHRPPPPRPQGYHARLPPPHPYPPVTGSGPPGTPDRSERHHRLPHAPHHSPYPPTPPPPLPPMRHEPVYRGGRPTGEVSPSRAQAWKKRRTVGDETLSSSARKPDPNPLSLSNDMQRSLSLREQKQHPKRNDDDLEGDLKSPSSIMQGGRSRKADALAGLAALSSAALLKLDEGK